MSLKYAQTRSSAAATDTGSFARPGSATTFLVGALCFLAGMGMLFNGIIRQPATATVDSTPGSQSAGAETSEFVTRPIEEISEGDLVVARDPVSGRLVKKKVLHAFRRTTTTLRLLTVRNSVSGDAQVLRTTDEHPFWVPQQDAWVDAKDLCEGDILQNVDGSPGVVIASDTELHPDGISVFNMEVEDVHTYFARAHGTRGPPVLTHNIECNRFDTVIETASANAGDVPGTGVFDTTMSSFDGPVTRDTSIRSASLGGDVHVVDQALDSGQSLVLGRGGYRTRGAAAPKSVFYHSAPADAVDPIMKSGFRTDIPTAQQAFHRNRFGRGVYLADSPSAVLAERPGGIVLSVDADLGRNLDIVYLGPIFDESMARAVARGARKHGYHSITTPSVKPNGGINTIVFDPANVRALGAAR